MSVRTKEARFSNSHDPMAWDHGRVALSSIYIIGDFRF